MLVEPVDLLRLTHVFEKLFLVLMCFEHLDQLGNSMLSFFVHPAVELLTVICRGPCNPQCCIPFPGNSVHRFVFPKMILLLVWVDLVILL